MPQRRSPSYDPAMPITRLLLAGATGLVGREVLVAARAAAIPVHAVARRLPAAERDAGVTWQAVDFNALPVLPLADAAICALGTTIKVAGSQAAFRAVDFDAVLAFARSARAAGVRHFGVVSALGAKAASANFYSHVKGEAEDALAGLGFEALAIARPSLLVGDREALGQPVRRGERIGLALTAPFGPLFPLRWRPIRARTVARALLTALSPPTPGVRIIESGELQRLGIDEPA